MLNAMTNPRIFLQKKEEQSILQGFPWVFDNEVAFVKAPTKEGIVQTPLASTNVEDGTLVEVYSKGGLLLGSGILNKKSKIVVRLLTKKAPQDGKAFFTKEFFAERIQDAINLRSLYFAKEDSYRLIFTEADLLPGLVVERFCDINGKIFLVVQFLTLGIEIFREEIIASLRELCAPDGIYERSDVKVRELEGLPLVKGWIGKSYNTNICIKENGILLNVDLENGQKTGYFLDQKINRQVCKNLANGRRVLDTCTHTGAFGLNAVLGGAKEVISVDISEDAIKNVNNNIALNKASNKMTAVCADVFALLKEYEQKKESFDMIILDPPAFTKSAKMIEKAFGGYKEINMRAMRLLTRGGILITCSCSHFFDATLFYNMLNSAAVDAKRTLQILEKCGPAPDHPVLVGYPKSDYLKCAVIRVL